MEDFKEQESLHGGGPSGVTSCEKWKFEDSKPPIAAKRVKRQYSAKQKVDYKAWKARERKVKKEGSVVPTRGVKHTVWAEVHQGVDHKAVDK